MYKIGPELRIYFCVTKNKQGDFNAGLELAST